MTDSTTTKKIKIIVEEDVKKANRINFESIILSLIDVVSSEHLIGLEKILVKSKSPIQKDAYTEALGLYYGKREGAHQPYVVLCAENIVARIENIPFVLRWLISPKKIIAETLFHEIGHHYQRISHGHKKKSWEKHADKYCTYMMRREFHSRGFGKLLKKIKLALGHTIKKSESPFN